jgi:uncharacterized membrane protein YoaK (UPF0700 family)
MARSKHARRISVLPQSPLRWVAAAMGAYSLLATIASDGPRYLRVVDFTLALVLLAVGCVPAEYRRRARAIVLSLMTVLLALAGVVAAVSIDEAMTLVAGAVTVGLMACLFTAAPRRARHAPVSA